MTTDNHNIQNNSTSSNNFSNFDNNTNSCIREEVKKTSKFKKFIKFVYTLLALPACFVFGIISTLTITYLQDFILSSYSSESIPIYSNIADSSSDLDTQNDILKIAINNAKSSVVSITSLSTTQDAFFKVPITYESAGSGIVFHKTSTKVYIVTNYHVVENASSIGVAFDEDSMPIYAQVVGSDLGYDLAVISVNYSDLPKEDANNITVARFVDTSQIEVGDYSIAIGNALGEGISSTFGIISSISQDIITDKGNSLNVLQTTAAINFGNSGGALVNLYGEIIGINTAKVAENGVERIGYTISSNELIPIVESIMNNTKPASLGVKVTNAQQSDDILGGALIVEIIQNSSAEKAGLNIDDIITSVNNAPILSAEQLVGEIKKYSIGDTLNLKIIRNGKVEQLKVKLY